MNGDDDDNREVNSSFHLIVVLMIIKGLFRRYERWNPVHPTYGAFYGMGVGIGCGVGWGPGFGPEVVGYVGAGCGIGFNVGITLAGFGIGLPANIIFAAPYNALLATKSSALKLARSGGLLSSTQTSEDVRIRNVPCVSDFQREAGEKLSCFRQNYLTINGTDIFDMKNSLPLLTTSACKSIQAFHSQLFCPGKESKD
ncbi:cadmium-induced protein AS8 isoform X2 [Cicer arietinum]|uniref:cadmium-induced protein AS8 isoform X2 n=1 Tax=Cicer arietinum TaxID=3827 RepID=UPI003CC527B3